MKIKELLFLKAYPFTLNLNQSSEICYKVRLAFLTIPKVYIRPVRDSPTRKQKLSPANAATDS